MVQYNEELTTLVESLTLAFTIMSLIWRGDVRWPRVRRWLCGATRVTVTLQCDLELAKNFQGESSVCYREFPAAVEWKLLGLTATQ
jgi:hypothetical protein